MSDEPMLTEVATSAAETKMTEESSVTPEMSTFNPASDGPTSAEVGMTSENATTAEDTATAVIPSGNSETSFAAPDGGSTYPGTSSPSSGSGTLVSTESPSVFTEIESSPDLTNRSMTSGSSRPDTTSHYGYTSTTASSVQTSITTPAIVSTDITTAGYHTTVGDNQTSPGLSQAAIIGIAAGVSFAVVLVLVILVVVVLRKRRMDKRKKYTEEENVNDYKLDIHHDTAINSPSASMPKANNFFEKEQLADGESLEMDNNPKAQDSNDNPLWSVDSNNESRRSLGPIILGFDDPESGDAALNSTNTFR